MTISVPLPGVAHADARSHKDSLRKIFYGNELKEFGMCPVPSSLTGSFAEMPSTNLRPLLMRYAVVSILEPTAKECA